MSYSQSPPNNALFSITSPAMSYSHCLPNNVLFSSTPWFQVDRAASHDNCLHGSRHITGFTSSMMNHRVYKITLYISTILTILSTGGLIALYATSGITFSAYAFPKIGLLALLVNSIVIGLCIYRKNRKNIEQKKLIQRISEDYLFRFVLTEVGDCWGFKKHSLYNLKKNFLFKCVSVVKTENHLILPHMGYEATKFTQVVRMEVMHIIDIRYPEDLEEAMRDSQNIEEKIRVSNQIPFSNQIPDNLKEDLLRKVKRKQ
ncbi:MAG: hypothetical protein R3E91_02930 [Chlamydiales bacterium]